MDRNGVRHVVRIQGVALVKIEIDLAAVGRSKWYEYVVRFAFGGAVTALAGIIAKRWGPGVGGLFLAFPAIFPATATLIEKHERQKKEKAGKNGRLRAREAAGLDAAGAAMGGVGLITFAIVVWRGIPTYPIAMVLGLATAAWLTVAVLTWGIHEHFWRRLEHKFWGKSKPLAKFAISRQSSAHRRSDE